LDYLKDEDICGRPLGLRFDKKNGDLYIADAYLGIMKVGPEGGLATSVTNEADGVPLRFTNDLDIDDEGNVHFVRQYRHATGRDMLELPAGTRDDDEPYEECAAREVREEIGMAAGKLEKVGEFFLAPGYSTEFMVVFLATELKHNPLDADEDEFLTVEKIPLRKAMEMTQSGKILDAKSLAAFLLAKSHLEKYLG